MTAFTPNLDTMLERMGSRRASEAVIWRGQSLTYGDLLDRMDDWIARLRAAGAAQGTVCAFLGDYSPGSIALIYALMRVGAVAVPFTEHVGNALPELMTIAGVELFARFDADDTATLDRVPAAVPNDLISGFGASGRPGLVVFSSGSTGTPKGILHDCERVLGKFVVERRGWRTILFLMLDHFGGLNTLLACAAYGGVAVCPEQRSPEAVCRAIEMGRADLLPTTPTFLNMILLSRPWDRFDVSSVRLITYGAEPMPEVTLRRVAAAFPLAQLKQTYGLSELGVLHSQSPDRTSLWLKVGGPGFETRVVNGVLHVRSSSSMVGYLNAPSPIDADGWMSTGDLVEERDGMIRVIGRLSEAINVGGQKVFPAEVETVLLEADNIAGAVVSGTAHALLGQAVTAKVSLVEPEEPSILSSRLRRHCRERLAKFKVPMRFEVVDSRDLATERGKKRRSPAASETC
jgi:acyl-CoA synthetase (AMP-forming)/AMP-acid ligase II